MALSNLIARAAAAAISVALIACTDDVAPPPDPQAASEVGPSLPLPRSLPPPRETVPRYVGLWAASAEDCEVPAWRFEADRVSTLGEVSCRFDTVRLIPTGYDIAATCTAEAPPAPYQMQVAFAESARAMLISGGPWAATSLIYCGPLPQD